jgi:hypothetical protein
MDANCLYAYFAGAIDADGFITVQRSVKRSLPWQPTYFEAKVGFTGTAAPTVQNLLREAFGGSVYMHQPKNPAHKAWWTWRASGTNAETALVAILPFLQTKGEQAKFAIELIRMQREQWDAIKRTTKPPYRIPEEMMEARNELWERVTRLNEPRNRRIHFSPPQGN